MCDSYCRGRPFLSFIIKSDWRLSKLERSGSVIMTKSSGIVRYFATVILILTKARYINARMEGTEREREVVYVAQNSTIYSHTPRANKGWHHVYGALLLPSFPR